MNKKVAIDLTLGTLLLTAMFRAEAAPKCSLKTLKGTYIYGATGVKDKAVHVEAGNDVFDGKGGIINTYTGSDGKDIVTTGTYVMGANCIGRATYNDTGDSYAMYTGPGGLEVSWISVSQDIRFSGRMLRVSKSVNPQCSLKTLKGTYVYSHVGYRNGIQYFESGQEKYDGRGNLVNIYSDANGLEILTRGTYTMNKNCVGHSTYEDTGDSYALYTGPKGDDFSYVSLGSGQSNMTVGRERRVSKEIVE